MSKEYEKDELLAKLAKAAGKKKAPTLSEDILYKATRPDEIFGPRKWHTPKLLINLLGGAAVLAGIFALSANPPQRALIDPNFNLNLNQKMQGDALLAQGDVSFTEEQLSSPLEVSLSEWGNRAVGNYVSNTPGAFNEEMWKGQTRPEWVFVVTDGVYFPNGDNAELKTLFTAEELAQVAADLSTDSSQQGIKLLIQGEDGVLHPLVIKAGQDRTLYALLLEDLLTRTFSSVPLN